MSCLCWSVSDEAAEYTLVFLSVWVVYDVFGQVWATRPVNCKHTGSVSSYHRLMDDVLNGIYIYICKLLNIFTPLH